MTPELERAYETCRNIARCEAKNFYFSFVALPRHKRNAMCAVYAFMRHADDLSDDERKSHPERKQDLDRWMDMWRLALAGGETHDPVFLALADTCGRFMIPPELLEQLVHGTSMDLVRHTSESGAAAAHAGLETYATFEDLYQYCYYVASVVGLVCIRIFGYGESRAERLAEETGIAFQLTNILRDVREDAERGRVYLPVDELRAAGVTPEALAAVKGGGQMTPEIRAVLTRTGSRARNYYGAAQELLPLISPDSRPALWVLVSIYAQLLERIEAKHFDVFSEKIKVPTWRKLSYLVRGMSRTWMYRLSA